jgi:hypothetical protein
MPQVEYEYEVEYHFIGYKYEYHFIEYEYEVEACIANQPTCGRAPALRFTSRP